MSEEQQLKSTAAEESSHRHHHSHHHHHSGSSHSGEHHHHGSSHSGGHRHHHHHHSHRHSSRKKFSFKRLAEKLTPKSFSSTSQIKKIATSTSSAKTNSFTVTFGRIVFVLALLGVVCFSVSYIFFDDSDSAIFKAKNTPSETTQLKVQIVQLEEALEEVEAELAKYKAKYGELEENDEVSTEGSANTQN